MQFHKAKEHGEKNQMSGLNSVKEYNSKTNRQEIATRLEENLKEEISKFRYYNT